ncbi:MAG: hypothetical protein AAF671_03840 [Pseudomonadota bacterium]
MSSTMGFLKVSLLVSAFFHAALVMADHHESKLPAYAERAVAIEIDAEVLSVDQSSRELVLLLPTGDQFTTVVDEGVERFVEIEQGDFVAVNYIAALAAELREPTDEELQNPWVEGVETSAAENGDEPGVAVVMGVRAVCTIEGMNRLAGTVTVLDSRGKAHVINDVAAERIESLSIGQSVVMTFTQAVAVGLEKVES